MTELYQPEEIAVYNQNALEELAWAIENSGGSFKLFLARCNYTNLRSRLAKRLQAMSTVQIRTLELKPSEQTLYNRIQAEIASEMPAALMVFGLETVTDLDRLLSSLNQVREEFLKNCHFSLILWINDEILTRMMRVAPDFESWATTTEFRVDRKKLKNYIIIYSNLWLTNQFKRPKSVSLSQIKIQIEAIQRDLRKNQPVLEPKIQAILESLMGAVQLSNNQRESALEHYQTALKLWQQLGDLEYQAKILTEITLCYYQQAMRHQQDHPSWQKTQEYLDRSLAVLKQLKQPGLYISSLLDFSRILRQVQGWDKWELVVRKLLIYHQNENNLIAMAQDYAFLAEATFAKKDWTSAKYYAESSLEILTPDSSQVSHDLASTNELTEAQSLITYIKSLSRFILAKSYKKLGQLPTAISNLEEILKTVTVPEYDPQLFLDLLNYLRELYLEQKQYLPAFEIKLKRQSIEQQYGLRAFVGAGRIQPQRQAKLILAQVDGQKESIASEIEASGRYRDLEKLIKRIGNSGCKLLVIHGQSGVGKSSLIQGGLVPKLKQTSLGIQDYLPVLVNVYTNWVAELGQAYLAALASKKIELKTDLDSATAILEQLQASESRNLRSVLIFDQFEEFFFAESDATQRRQFFNFLGDCLNILQVKVILCLREDYLHYLLECNRLDSMEVISKDILSKNVLYSLGNFSSEDAKAIIRYLTERSNFFLEPALIEELVQNLADDLEEVRPIELQVVGAQLQAESITKLAEYQVRGPKQELVKRYLAEVVNDCGTENQQLAELVLFLLTNEKGTRPLKNREEIEIELNQQLPSIEASQLDLVLNIFVGCGMVLLFKESQADRYQLVHDYLVPFVRKLQSVELLELREKLKQTEAEKQILAEATRKAQRLIDRGKAVLSISLVLAATVMGVAWQQVDKAQQLTQLDRYASDASRLFESGNNQIDALISAVKAGKELKATVKDVRSLADYPISTPQIALNQILDNIREQNLFKGHQDWVISVSFSPDGKYIATASYDKTARLWDVTGKLIQEFKGHQARVLSVSFSPDGKYIATGSGDKTARLWDFKGNLIQEFKGHQDGLSSVSFSPDGKYIATGSGDKTARLWDFKGNLIQEFEGHQNGLSNVSFSPDGKYIATASYDKTARLWDITGNLIQEFKGHQGGVSSVSFSPDGKYIATASSDKTAILWDVTGKLIQEFKGHQSEVISISFSPDGKYIATGSEDNTPRLWDIKGNLIQEFKGHQGLVSSVSFSPDGKHIATASYDKTARLWDFKGKLIQEFKGHQYWVISVSFSPDGKYIATASHDKTARLWDFKGNLIQEFKGDQDWVSSVSFSPDGKYIATASEDKTARLWDLTGKLIQEFKGHQGGVWSVSFSPDGKYIATASWDKTVRLWDLTGKLIQEFQGHQGPVSSVSFSPDGKYIATASEDKTVRLWDLTGKLIQEFQGHQGGVRIASFSPDGKYIATASYDNTARLWDLTGTLIQEFKGHQGAVSSVSFSPDSKYIATASWDNTARLWDLTGKLIQEFKGHQGQLWSVSFSPDGKYIATASGDNTARLWRIKSLDEMLVEGCDWLHDYLQNNADESDRHLCDGITPRKDEISPRKK